MTIESRIKKLEQHGGDRDESVAILLAGRDRCARGEQPAPRTEVELAELEEMAKRYPKSMWVRLYEGRKRTGG